MGNFAHDLIDVQNTRFWLLPMYRRRIHASVPAPTYHTLLVSKKLANTLKELYFKDRVGGYRERKNSFWMPRKVSGTH